jgi:hypothetical protein
VVLLCAPRGVLCSCCVVLYPIVLHVDLVLSKVSAWLGFCSVACQIFYPAAVGMHCWLQPVSCLAQGGVTIWTGVWLPQVYTTLFSGASVLGAFKSCRAGRDLLGAGACEPSRACGGNMGYTANNACSFRRPSCWLTLRPHGYVWYGLGVRCMCTCVAPFSGAKGLGAAPFSGAKGSGAAESLFGACLEKLVWLTAAMAGHRGRSVSSMMWCE